jgi:copper/silver efflux system protein
MFLLGYNMSIASAVGFIALGGVAAEIGIVMVVYLNQSVLGHASKGELQNESQLLKAIVEGAALRVRPIAMTGAVIIAGLLPIMWGNGTGSEIMRRIAAPMIWSSAHPLHHALQILGNGHVLGGDVKVTRA